MRRRLTRAEKQAQTRAALLEAAGRVFVSHGFQGASVERITAEAGFSRGAFYSNFSSKEELFAELLQDRVYSLYAEMANQRLQESPDRLPDERQTGEHLAAIQADLRGQWIFSLWLELLAAVGRDTELKGLAARFWSGNRALTAKVLANAFPDGPPIPAEDLATAMIALDIGLAVQHFVDPDAAPLSLYPELFEALLRPLREPGWLPAAKHTPRSHPDRVRKRQRGPGG
jgi:AcrR family transcriptional regulator